MTLKHTDIIPIVYVGGTGGNFLGYLLTSAKYKMSDGVDFSKHGNAHYSYKDIPQPSMGNTLAGSADDAIFDFINKIQPFENNAVPPYFCPCHVKNMNRVVDMFDKSIQLTFTHEDVDDLVLVIMGKWWVDTRNQSPTAHNIRISNAFRLDYNIHLKNFPPIVHPSVLNISWNELYKGEVNSLIQKLSNFTEIPVEDFLIEKLIEWRERTTVGIEELKEQINLLNKI